MNIHFKEKRNFDDFFSGMGNDCFNICFVTIQSHIWTIKKVFLDLILFQDFPIFLAFPYI